MNIQDAMKALPLIALAATGIIAIALPLMLSDALEALLKRLVTELFDWAMRRVSALEILAVATAAFAVTIGVTLVHSVATVDHLLQYPVDLSLWFAIALGTGFVFIAGIITWALVKLSFQYSE
jgi:hypothetical protein